MYPPSKLNFCQLNRLLKTFQAKGRAIALFLLPAIGLLTLMTPPAVGTDPIRLTNDTADVRGTTVGSNSLTQLASRDRRRKLCLGYGGEQPDHTLVLTEAQPYLRIAVESEGRDTTLLIQGPWGIDCNDNYRRDRRDAAITARNWPPGTYQIWVGAFNQGDQLDYSLRIFRQNRTRQGGL